MLNVVSDLIKHTKIEFLKNDLTLTKMSVTKKAFEQLKKELELVIRYTENKLPENKLKYIGVIIELDESEE